MRVPIQPIKNTVFIAFDATAKDLCKLTTEVNLHNNGKITKIIACVTKRSPLLKRNFWKIYVQSMNECQDGPPSGSSVFARIICKQ